MEGVRVAEADDAQRCLELAEEFVSGLASRRGGSLLLVQSEDSTGWVSDVARFGQLLDDPDRLLLIGTLDGVVTGLAMGHVEPLPDGRPLGFLDACYVKPDARGVGLGRLLLDGIVGWLSDRNCVGVDGMALPGDREAKNFFEASGFKARLLTMHHTFE
jgi:GNAT superfamily N-acetyltransferase